jgi:hypothetical protein
MKITTAFPSSYIRAADLQDRNVKVVMDHVKMEDIGSDHKPVLYFQGKEKGLVLNKTNANTISSAYGDDTDDWVGKELVLFPTVTDFQGRSVDAIRVRKPAAKDGARPVVHVPQQPPPDNFESDSEIPF